MNNPKDKTEYSVSLLSTPQGINQLIQNMLKHAFSSEEKIRRMKEIIKNDKCKVEFRYGK